MRRAFTVILLVVEALFFNVVLPGHARGMIQLPGSDNCPACCAARHQSQKQSPCDNERTTHCAICAFAAGLVVPPPIDFAPPPTALLAILAPPAAQHFEFASLPLPYFGRAPPASAA
jgi:hypothetical protein